MLIARRQSVSFDTLVNAVYERRLQEFVEIKSVRLRVVTRGRGRIDLYRVNQYGDQRLQSLDVSDDREEAIFDVSLSAPSRQQIGRLYFNLTAEDESFFLYRAEWSVLDAQIADDPKIDVVICTFNNPKETIDNVLRLLNYAPTQTAMNAIFVVDQGTRRVTEHHDFPLISDHPEAHRLRLVSQINLGGSGGFTRGMIESLKSREASHVLLLDDDVVIDPRLIDRVASIYKISAEPFIFGGAMMDLFRPNYLAAHAEVFDYKIGGCRTLPPADVDCRNTKALNGLIEPTFPSYNAWWFCCIPRALIDENGLPLPFFVRTDDAEYGTRLTGAGYRIFQLPGVFVWHRPFNAKPSAWMAYYSLRNDLVLCNLRSTYRRTLRRRYWALFWFMLINLRYDQVLAAILALEDYLAGPDHIFHNIADRHKSVTKTLGEYAPKVLQLSSYAWLDSTPSQRFAPFLPKFVRAAACAWWTYVLPPKKYNEDEIKGLRIIEPAHHHQNYVYGESMVRVWSSYDNAVTTYKKDLKKAWSLSFRFLKVMSIWILRADSVAKTYVKESPKYGSTSAWMSLIEAERQKEITAELAESGAK